MSLQFLFKLLSFIEICSITIGNTNYLITIERRENTRNALNGDLLIETAWHLWVWDYESDCFQEYAQCNVYLPVFQAIDLSFYGNDLYGFAESNDKYPLLLLHWSKINTKPLKINQEVDIFQPYHLPLEQLKRINIPPRDDWSSVFLNTREWLFNPKVFIQQNNKFILGVVNTAIASTLILQYSIADHSWEVKSYIESALEPVYSELPGYSFLAYRKVDVPWSVFYNTQRYSTVYGTTALPLFLSLLNNSGKIIQKFELSKFKGMCNTYLFDFASDGNESLYLSIIGGIKENPFLSVYSSKDYGKTWNLKKEITLPKIPLRIKMSVNTQNALIGLVFKERDCYKVTAVCLRF